MLFVLLLLTACATDPHRIIGMTTFHPTQRTEVFFVCEKYERNDNREHLHCNAKESLLEFKYSF